MACEWPDLIEGQWNLVASGITLGLGQRLNSSYKYYEHHVAADSDAPESSIKDKSPLIFEDSNSETISSSYSMDVYIYPEKSGGGETISQALRVDAS